MPLSERALRYPTRRSFAVKTDLGPEIMPMRLCPSDIRCDVALYTDSVLLVSTVSLSEPGIIRSASTTGTPHSSVSS